MIYNIKIEVHSLILVYRVIYAHITQKNAVRENKVGALTILQEIHRVFFETKILHRISKQYWRHHCK